MPGKIGGDLLTQGAMRLRVQKRHGLFTNVKQLQSLSKHCDGLHDHQPGDDYGDHSGVFASEFAVALTSWKEGPKLKFMECWDIRVSRAMEESGAQVSEPLALSDDLDHTRSTLFHRMQQNEINFIVF